LKYCFRHQIIYIKYRILWKDCQQNKMTQFEVQVDQYKADGNKAVCFKLVRSTKDLTNPEIDFHPDMCHQVFGDSETIFGYKNLSIKIYFAACSLTIYLAVEYAEKINKAISGGVEADDIMAALTKDLIPPGHLTNIDQFASRVSSDNEFKPFGVLKQAYTTEDDGRHFEIYQPTMDTPGFREFHSRLQIFLIFFVDAASFIDADDDRWSFLVLYEKFKDDSGEWRHAVAGYMTAYRYYAYPDRVRPRISQFIVLPPYQRRGHGCRLLEAFYSESLADPAVLDITVEDPVDTFQRLRDFVDCRRLLFEAPELFANPVALANGFTETMATVARERLRLNKRQARRCYEILWLRCTNRSDPSAWRNYRLTVKSRLNQPFRKSGRELAKAAAALESDELQAVLGDLSRQQRIGHLAEAFDQLVSDYGQVLDRLASVAITAGARNGAVAENGAAEACPVDCR
ncbi:hypothetical protein BOX15_Mlig020729g3, partial [Macrostomum lignano]